MSFDQPVRVDMTLLKEPAENIITSNIMPVMRRKTLTWTLAANQPLVFKDNNAAFLWSELKSYIEVDQIKIMPLK